MRGYPYARTSRQRWRRSRVGGIVFAGFSTDAFSSHDGTNVFATIAGSIGGAGARLIVKFSLGWGCTCNSGTEHKFCCEGTCRGSAFGILGMRISAVWPACTLKGCDCFLPSLQSLSVSEQPIIRVLGGIHTDMSPRFGLSRNVTLGGAATPCTCASILVACGGAKVSVITRRLTPPTALLNLCRIFVPRVWPRWGTGFFHDAIIWQFMKACNAA